MSAGRSRPTVPVLIRGKGLLAGIAVGACLVGCVPAAAPTAATQEATFRAQTWEELLADTSIVELAERNRETRRQAAAEGTLNLGEKSELDVDLVRIVEQDEWASILARCINDAGFPATAIGQTVEMGEVPEEQTQAFNYAVYRCHMQYPANPLAGIPYPEQPASELFDYWVDSVVPCLRGQGVAVDDPPSKEVWMNGMARGVTEWRPFDLVEQGVSDSADIQWLYEECPEYPEGFFPPAGQ